jgi:CDP-4-dehydro-6-deoxyglucose reductase, E1
MFYDLASSSWDQEELAALRRVIDSGRFTMGEHVRRFEEAFAQHLGVRHAVMLASGSAANLVGVAALCHARRRPLRAGDEVIVPAISWPTTYYPLHQYGLRLRFVDVELETLNMDVSQVERAITPRTRMIVAVNILGNPSALDVLRKICDRHGLWLFEDNCESLGAALGGRPCGTFGDLGTFSFFFSHQISTMEGGMLVTDDTEIDQLARSLRAHGWTRDLPPGSPLAEPRPDDFAEQYRFILPGYNARPLELSGAVGLEQLRKLEALVAARRRNAELFVRLFGGDDRFVIQREHGRSSWFSFTIVLSPGLAVGRATVLDALRRADIGFRMITGGCFLRHEVIRYIPHEGAEDVVQAHVAHDRGFFVGNHPADLTPQLLRLREVLDAAVPLGDA